MAKRTLLACSLLAIALGTLPAAPQPWGTWKKIQFFAGLNQVEAVRQNMQELNCDRLPRLQKQQIVDQMTAMGDRYLQNRQFDLAEEFYRKALQIRTDAWPIYGKLEQIRRLNGAILVLPANLSHQLQLLVRSFQSSFLLANCLLNSFYFSALLVAFLFALLMFWKYFQVAATDISGSPGGVSSLPSLILLVALLAWPALAIGGWGYYPFLIFGVLYIYLSAEERGSVRILMGLVLACSLLYSFNRYLEQSAYSQDFQNLQRVFHGELFPERVWRRFDPELKTLQAYAYYEQGNLETTIDILDSTGPGYKSPLKFDLLGNIQLEMGNIPESIQNYRESLTINDQSPITLKNFTLALLKGGDSSLVAKYTERYPEILEYRKTVTAVQAIPLPEDVLWKRLLNFSQPSFRWPDFLKRLLFELGQLPSFIGLLLFVAYLAGLPRLLPALGHSAFCARCQKIIPKPHMEQAHALCDECFQLFLIKDPIFLEAKIIKEKEIHRHIFRRYLAYLLLSLPIPGFNLANKDRGRWFVLCAWPFFLLLTFTLSASAVFRGLFHTAPMLLNYTGILAFLIYLLVNLLSVRGDEDGF